MAAYDNWIAKNAARRQEDQQTWNSRNALEQEKAMGGVTDETTGMGEGVAQTDWLGRSNLTQNDTPAASTEEVPGQDKGSEAGGNAAVGVAKGLASGNTNPMDLASMGAFAAGGPVGIGAGLALAAISSNQKRKQARENAKYDAKVAAFDARRQALQHLAQIGQNLKA